MRILVPTWHLEMSSRLLHSEPADRGYGPGEQCRRAAATPGDLFTEIPGRGLGLPGATDRGRGSQHVAGLALGQFGESCRLVDRVADHRVLRPGGCADLPGERTSRRHPDTEPAGGQPTQQRVAKIPSRAQRGARAVAEFAGCTEDRQRRVAFELVD